MVYDRFSKFGIGRRTLFGTVICEDEDNIFQNSEKFWEDAENSEIITFKEDEIKFVANGKIYAKWLYVKPNTSYFLAFKGRTDPRNWTDFNFGILGEDSLAFENRHTSAENAFYVFKEGQDQVISIKGQDGEWYKRTYMFRTFDTEKVAFFAVGNTGTVFLKDLYLFEANNAVNPDFRKESTAINYGEDIKNCLKENNYADDLSVFQNGDNYGQFVKFDNGKLHYSYNQKGCYYFAWLPIESNRIYTFVYSDTVKKSGDAVYGFVTENQDGKRKWLSQKSAKTQHDKQTTADAFAIVKGDKVAFAVFDGGGEVEISDLKVFLFGNGIDD